MEETDARSCEIKLRDQPRRRKEKVRVGCGAGFAGDRPRSARRLLERVEGLDYLVLECLAERTLVDRYRVMLDGGKGYDPRIPQWMSLLLPLSVKKRTCIITNMGAVDPHGAQREILNVAKKLDLHINVALAYETDQYATGHDLLDGESDTIKGAVSTYLGAAPIVECLERYKPDVIVTSRVADAALFVGPMVYELGWNWNDFELLAQGSLAGHLLECGCQLTGGYFAHPGDKYRNLSFQQLLDMSLPFAEVSYDGGVCVAKEDGSGGLLNVSTCAEQLLYEVGDPGSYVTPDVVINFQDVTFHPLSEDKVECFGTKPSQLSVPNKLLQLIPKASGWKAWGEISYGGYECIKRAEAARFLVLSWMEEACPGIAECIVSYMIGKDSLKVCDVNNDETCLRTTMDVRLRMDGIFKLKDHATSFVNEFMALYTNGPAGGGGISTGHKEEIVLLKQLVAREAVFWKTEAILGKINNIFDENITSGVEGRAFPETIHDPFYTACNIKESLSKNRDAEQRQGPAPSNKQIPLLEVAHSRAGDKGNDLNFSIIPHFSQDLCRLKKIISPQWVIQVVSPLLNSSSFPDSSATKKRDAWINENVSVEIYETRGISSLNVVVRNILDGGVNCSRRIDRHGKTVSDLILSQKVVLSPPSMDN